MKMIEADVAGAAAPVAGNAMAGPVEADKPLDVHMQQGSWPRPLVAARRRRRHTRPRREAVPPGHLPARRASPAPDPRQPARPIARQTPCLEDRLLLAGTQLPRRAVRPTRAIAKRTQAATSLKPAMPP